MKWGAVPEENHNMKHESELRGPRNIPEKGGGWWLESAPGGRMLC
jgi:hypothetical protein